MIRKPADLVQDWRETLEKVDGRDGTGAEVFLLLKAWRWHLPSHTIPLGRTNAAQVGVAGEPRSQILQLPYLLRNERGTWLVPAQSTSNHPAWDSPTKGELNRVCEHAAETFLCSWAP